MFQTALKGVASKAVLQRPANGRPPMTMLMMGPGSVRQWPPRVCPPGCRWRPRPSPAPPPTPRRPPQRGDAPRAPLGPVRPHPGAIEVPARGGHPIRGKNARSGPQRPSRARARSRFRSVRRRCAPRPWCRHRSAAARRPWWLRSPAVARSIHRPGGHHRHRDLHRGARGAELQHQLAGCVAEWADRRLRPGCADAGAAHCFPSPTPLVISATPTPARPTSYPSAVGVINQLGITSIRLYSIDTNARRA